MKAISFVLMTVALIFSFEMKAQCSYEKSGNLFELRYTPTSKGSKGNLMKFKTGDPNYEYLQAEVYNQLVLCNYQKQLSDAFADVLPIELRKSMKNLKIFMRFKMDVSGNIHDISFTSKEDFQHIITKEWLEMIVNTIQSINVSITVDETKIESYYKDKEGLFWVHFTFPPYYWK